MAEVVVTCFKCGKQTRFVDRVGFRDECEHCGEDAHVCKDCQFYDRGAYNECREPQAELVQEKERANRCDYFVANGLKDAVADKRDALKEAAEALFKKK